MDNMTIASGFGAQITNITMFGSVTPVAVSVQFSREQLHDFVKHIRVTTLNKSVVNHAFTHSDGHRYVNANDLLNCVDDLVLCHAG